MTETQIPTPNIQTKAREKLLEKFKGKFESDQNLSRKVVSFQANKKNAFYRWFKYKEGFSSNLVSYYIQKYNAQGKTVFDPFVGTGTTLFASGVYGCDSIGIELLPVGVFYMEVRQVLSRIRVKEVEKIWKSLWIEVYKTEITKPPFEHISITQGAFPKETENLLFKYLIFIEGLNSDYRTLFRFAAFSVLESISYTRKDGQYLRWDYRSNRKGGKSKFNKGRILDFEEAIENKLSEIIVDLKGEGKESDLFADAQPEYNQGEIQIFQDSCLDRMPLLKESSVDLVITSPPYCNRYDYTRTYALELVFLGNDNDEVKKLRQTMLSCTVENKSKFEAMRAEYKSRGQEKDFEKIVSVFNKSDAMTEVTGFLNELKDLKMLNNNGIARMVHNYFLEMCFTIYELSRIMKKGGRVVMVNDNVRYNGEEIPVDLILSEFAEAFGLETDRIYVLDQKKGNSSQQMGNHGRTPLRKCVYIWQRV